MAAPIATVGAVYGYRGDEDSAAEWFSFGEQIAPDVRGQLHGIVLLRADIDLHHGRFEDATARMQSPEASFWWRALYLATRAEAFVAAGSSAAAEAIQQAKRRIGDHRAAEGILLRASGMHSNDSALIRESLAVFQEIECPYQAARSGWLLGGEDRERSRERFAALGTGPPAEPAA